MNAVFGILFVLALASAQPRADEPTGSAGNASNPESSEATASADVFLPDSLEVMSILGSADSRQRLTGSAEHLDEDFLEDWEYDDAGRALKLIPGVYVRDEDGFGLRPNIGLRGANSDRSKKIVLMEDGVLFAPAPYSAAAAYFFPLLTRMSGLEVFKGPASIRHGPNTIGGAVNLLSRPIPNDTQALIDVAGGQQLYGKAHGAFGTRVALGRGSFGVLVEGVHLRSDGFKELDGGGNTGFGKNEAMLKLRYEGDPSASIYQWVELKLLYSDERSNETYLGLTEEDFRENPRRRYVASEDGRLEFRRAAVRLTHVAEFGSDFEIRSTVYRSDLERTWDRLNTLRGGPLTDVLYSGDELDVALLSGERDSGENDVFGFVSNDRVYYSMGAQTALMYRPDLFDAFSQDIELGVRVHQDQVRRFHTQESRVIEGGALVANEDPEELLTHNVDRTTAYSAHLVNTIEWGGLTLVPGVRAESIGWRRRDRRTRATTVNRYGVLLPGIGAYYGLTPELGILGGVHRGFSPVAPGDLDARPEFSVNYELGSRYRSKAVEFEAVGFFNDYSNLTNICSASGNCPEEIIDAQFDGGEVNVYGAEASVRGNYFLSDDLTLNGGLAYTF
ncbi:MAG: TonB-dependent receptor, partial [Myxococcota bacterium]